MQHGVKDDRQQVVFSELYAVVGKWYDAQGMSRPSKSALGRRLSERGFRRGKAGHNRDRAYGGLRLKRSDEPRPPEMAQWLQEAGILETDRT